MTRKEWMTTREVSFIAGVAVSTLNQWACRGTGGPPYYQAYPGAQRRYRRAEVEAWMEQSRHVPRGG